MSKSQKQFHDQTKKYMQTVGGDFKKNNLGYLYSKFSLNNYYIEQEMKKRDRLIKIQQQEMARARKLEAENKKVKSKSASVQRTSAAHSSEKSSMSMNQ